MSSINGFRKTSISLPACLGPDMRVVNKRYFCLCHNHGGRLNMHIIIDHVRCGYLISPNGLIPSVLSPNLIFFWIIRVVLMMSKIKCFHCLPSTVCQIFPSILRFTCQSNSSTSLGFENICFKVSITCRYHIIRAGTFLSLEPLMS
jgi:hypothetical protein